MSEDFPLDLQSPHNFLLSCLPSLEYKRLAGHLRPITLPQGEVLYDPAHKVERVYFPESGMISMVMEAPDAPRGLEVGIIGREGMLGMHTAQDSHLSFTRAVMQVSGKGWWLPTELFHEEYRRGGLLSALVLQHLQMMLAQTSQSALCCTVHKGVPRLCRWLLLARLCTGRDQLDLTHEFLGEMLGTQRASVTQALSQLEHAGAIATRRGGLAIVSVAALEAKACGCYRVLAGRYHDLLEGYRAATRP